MEKEKTESAATVASAIQVIETIKKEADTAAQSSSNPQ